MSQDDTKQDKVIPVTTKPKKKVERPIEETVWHNNPVVLGLALIVSMFFSHYFAVGALVVLLIFWWYAPKSYDRRKIHVKYANISRKGVFVCLYAFTLIVGANLLIVLSREVDLVFLQTWIPWMLILIRVALGYCGLLFISLEWGKNISEWLTYEFAPSLAKFSGKGMATKTQYFKSKDKTAEKPVEKSLISSSEGRTLSRKDELDKKSGTPDKDKQGFNATTSMIGG